MPHPDCSKQKDGIPSGCQWNLNHVQKVQSWSLIILAEDEIKSLPNYEKLALLNNGTLVVWQDLDKFAIGENDITDAFSRKMSLIRDHLSLVFHRFLSGEPGLKKLDILMNGLAVIPHDPFYIKRHSIYG